MALNIALYAVDFIKKLNMDVDNAIKSIVKNDKQTLK